MELDPIAYIDIVQIWVVILAPGKPLNRSYLHCSPRSSSFMHRDNKQLLPSTLALMPREKNIIIRPQWPLCPWPSQRSELALNYSHPSAQGSLWGNFSESAVRAGGASSSRWSHVKASQTAAASQNRRTKLTAQMRKQAQPVLTWYGPDLCGRIQFSKVGNIFKFRTSQINNS